MMSLRPEASSVALLSSRAPGTEKWHDRQTMPGSAGRAYQWPNKNMRIHQPLAEADQDELIKDEQGNVLPVRKEGSPR